MTTIPILHRDILLDKAEDMNEDDKFMLDKYFYWTKDEIACYNKAIDDAMEALKDFSKDHSIRNDPFLYHFHLVQKLESLKKK